MNDLAERTYQHALIVDPNNNTALGPGDPELITRKAARVIHSAQVICYLTVDGHSQGRAIAASVIAERSELKLPTAREIAVEMPMAHQRDGANQAYDLAAEQIRTTLEAGQDVAFLCEGDPLFFGSFAYLLARLKPEGFACQVIPGISSPQAGAAALASPLTLLNESCVVMSGRHDQAELEQALADNDSVVIMKAGRSRARILDAINATGRSSDARYLEFISRDNQRIETDISTLDADSGPYFSLFIICKDHPERVR